MRPGPEQGGSRWVRTESGSTAETSTSSSRPPASGRSNAAARWSLVGPRWACWRAASWSARSARASGSGRRGGDDGDGGPGLGRPVERALKTYVPPGEYDPYFMFASGGHSGQMSRDRRAVDARAEGDPRLHTGCVAGVRLRQRPGQRRPGGRVRPRDEQPPLAGATPTTRPCPRPRAATTAGGSTSTTARTAGSR